MYAIIESGNKQYRVREGDVIQVDLMSHPIGTQVEIDRVLLLANDSGVKVGRPLVEGAKVIARVEALEKGEKLLVWKYRPKQRYRRRRGHRQLFSRLRIEKIIH